MSALTDSIVAERLARLNALIKELCDNPRRDTAEIRDMKICQEEKRSIFRGLVHKTYQKEMAVWLIKDDRLGVDEFVFAEDGKFYERWREYVSPPGHNRLRIKVYSSFHRISAAELTPNEMQIIIEKLEQIC